MTILTYLASNNKKNKKKKTYFAILKNPFPPTIWCDQGGGNDAVPLCRGTSGAAPSA